MYNDMETIEECMDLMAFEEGIKDMIKGELVGTEPSQKGKYHKYKIGSIDMYYDGKKITLPIECDSYVTNSDKMMIRALERNANAPAYKKFYEKNIDKIYNKENGKLRCILLGGELYAQTPGQYIEYEAEGKIKHKTINPGIAVF